MNRSITRQDREAYARTLYQKLHGQPFSGTVILGQDSHVESVEDGALLTTQGSTRDDLIVASNAQMNQVHGHNGDDTILALDGQNLFYGESGNDILVGGDSDDHLSGGDGRDQLNGMAGEDLLLGGQGDDVLDGGAGNDALYGGAGRDLLKGGDGHDSLFGGDGNDQLSGGSGNDTLHGNHGQDSLSGGLGHDDLYGGSGNDVLRGQEGHDQLFGGSGDDQLSGDSGDDKLYGGSGHDRLNGGSGNDLLSGEDGNDTLKGGEGRDRLSGGRGDDLLTGGEGADLFVWQRSDLGGNDSIRDFTPGEDQLDLTDVLLRGDLPGHALRLTHAPSGSQLLICNQEGETVQTIAFKGVDLSQGGQRTDGEILQQILCDSPQSSIEASQVSGSDQDDRLYARSVEQPVHGLDGDDRLVAHPLGSFLAGDAGNDWLQGASGDDWLAGGTGKDTLQAGAGDDVLRGGAGIDQLSGEEGGDLFVWHRADLDGMDEVLDFDLGEDRLHFVGLEGADGQPALHLALQIDPRGQAILAVRDDHAQTLHQIRFTHREFVLEDGMSPNDLLQRMLGEDTALPPLF